MYKLTLTIISILFIGATKAHPSVNKEREIDPYIFEDTINSTIEGLRPNLPDPLIIEKLDLNLGDEGLLTGNASLSNLEITGIRGFQLPFLNIAVIGMRLNFTFVLPSLNINTNYFADLLAADLVPLYGEGKANIHITNLQIEATGQADLSNGIQVKNLEIHLQIGDATFDIHGILNDEDFSLIVSAIMNDVVAKFINEHPQLISSVLNPIVEAIINGILGGGGDSATAAAPEINFVKLQ